MKRAPSQDRETRRYLTLLSSLAAWLRQQSDGSPRLQQAVSGIERMMAGLRRGKTRPLALHTRSNQKSSRRRNVPRPQVRNRPIGDDA